VAAILVEDWTFVVRTLVLIFLVLVLFAPTHSNAGIQIDPTLFVQRFQRKTMHLTFRKCMILIVRHFINNYYELGS